MEETSTEGRWKMGHLRCVQQSNIRHNERSLLAYKKLAAKLLTGWQFFMNVYDPCVWNSQISGKKCTFVYHIDDILLLHLQPETVTLYIKCLEKQYAHLNMLTMTQRKLHKYLGMTVDF